MAQIAPEYPATLQVDYPERLDRLTTFFRIIVAIPILVILALLTSGGRTQTDNTGLQLGSVGLVFLPLILMILFRRKYPRWWFDWNLALTQFSNRVSAYLLLLRDDYPSTDEEQAVHISIPYPDAQTELNRWLPLVKWLLAIPHFVVLAFLGIAVFFVTIFAWFAILITGSYPRGLFDFVVGFLRWGLRVIAYALILTTDRYPPFSLSE